MNAINRTPADDDVFRCWVDHPTSASLSSHRVVIRGWCYHRGGIPMAALRVRAGTRLFLARHGDSRPDVHAMFGADGAGEATGFECALALPGGESLCTLEAQLEASPSNWIALHSFRVTAPRRSAADRVNWGRFWASAWLGLPRLSPPLTEDDRQFVLASARQRGWVNLQLVAQHEPRPVAPERFPRARLSRDSLPRLTIVTPSFQQGPFLEATLCSVLEQRDVNIDHIVQDGGSTDGSVQILQRYGPQLKHWESTADAGQADAIVRGFAHMECGPDDVMMYLNSDDLLMPGAARFVAEYFARHPDVDVLYGHRVFIDDDGREIGRWYSPRRQCDDLRLQDMVPQETLFWRRRAWDRVGGIDRRFHFAMDWDLLLRFADAGMRFARVPWFLGMFRLHARQKSQAQLHERGIPEMDQLRERTFGRPPPKEALQLSMWRAQVDSALLLALSRRGIRL